MQLAAMYATCHPQRYIPHSTGRRHAGPVDDHQRYNKTSEHRHEAVSGPLPGCDQRSGRCVHWQRIGVPHLSISYAHLDVEGCIRSSAQLFRCFITSSPVTMTSSSSEVPLAFRRALARKPGGHVNAIRSEPDLLLLQRWQPPPTLPASQQPS